MPCSLILVHSSSFFMETQETQTSTIKQKQNYIKEELKSSSELITSYMLKSSSSWLYPSYNGLSYTVRFVWRLKIKKAQTNNKKSTHTHTQKKKKHQKAPSPPPPKKKSMGILRSYNAIKMKVKNEKAGSGYGVGGK